MGRSTRMFEIIQILRTSTHPKTAQEIAAELEVTKRTIYRDVASLQAMRVPIEGEAGVGYIMRSGYDLPPTNFNIEEAEAISVGLSMITRTGDRSLMKAAVSAMRKLHESASYSESLVTSDWGIPKSNDFSFSIIRASIREERALKINYRDVKDVRSDRTILPVAIIYNIEAALVAAWCELRVDFRHFRLDRIVECEPTQSYFTGRGQHLRREWAKLYAQNL